MCSVSFLCTKDWKRYFWKAKGMHTKNESHNHNKKFHCFSIFFFILWILRSVMCVCDLISFVHSKISLQISLVKFRQDILSGLTSLYPYPQLSYLLYQRSWKKREEIPHTLTIGMDPLDQVETLKRNSDHNILTSINPVTIFPGFWKNPSSSPVTLFL